MFSFFLSILQGFYDEVSNPMLIDVELNYPENEISDLTTNNFKHFYDGSEIVVAGRFVDSNQNHLCVDVRGEGVSMDFFDLCKLHKIWMLLLPPLWLTKLPCKCGILGYVL